MADLRYHHHHTSSANRQRTPEGNHHDGIVSNGNSHSNNYASAVAPIPRTASMRSASRSASSSARNSGAFDPPQQQQQPLYRYNPSLRSVGSRVSLSEQFATTRREYEFGFDDAMSLFAPSSLDDRVAGDGYSYSARHSSDDDDDDDDEDDGDEDDDETSTANGSFDGVVVVEGPSPPLSPADAQGKARSKRSKKKGQKGSPRKMMARSPWELLCLDPEMATVQDIRRAYFRLYETLRSSALDKGDREMAERYFAEVQHAFEDLLARKKAAAGRSEDAFEIEVDDDDDDDGDTSSLEGDSSEQEGHRRDVRFRTQLKQQQHRPWMEAGLQLGLDPLIRRRRHPGRSGTPSVAVSLAGASTTTLPAVSAFVGPKLQKLSRAIHTRRQIAPQDGTHDANNHEADWYVSCAPTTLHITPSLLAVAKTNSLSPFLTPNLRSPTGLQQKLVWVPDTIPKDQIVRWSLQTLFCTFSYHVRLRQEVHLLAQQEQRACEMQKRRIEASRLPDAVVEIEADALNPGSVVARASLALPIKRRNAVVEDDDRKKRSAAEPVHIEASVALGAQGGSWVPRLGLAGHKKDAVLGGTRFVCADSGLWALSRRDWVFAPFWHSSPTVEVGYRFGGGGNGTVLGTQSGRPFTKQAKTGLRRLHDEVEAGEVDLHRQEAKNISSSGSWTVSGAATSGGVLAGYVRYGKDLTLSLPTPLLSCWKMLQPLDGWHVEAELCAQKAIGLRSFSLDRLASAAVWGPSELNHLAVRGLKKMGQSCRFGLELRLYDSSSSVVLSLYLSQADKGTAGTNSKRFALPILLLRDTAVPASALCGAAAAVLLPFLGLAAVDWYRSWWRKDDSVAATAAAAKKDKAKRALYRQRRAEADELVTLLAGPVTARQQRLRSKGGLVVLSAKYGVLASSRTPSSSCSIAATTTLLPHDGGNALPALQWAAPEEVADVTVAIAALVDDGDGVVDAHADDGDGVDEGRERGVVLIPAGVRKSRLLGFWDPEPGRTKCLVVRYLFNGQERVKAVMGREELRLP